MEAPAPIPWSQSPILGCSSVFCFGSVLESKGSPKRSDKELSGSQPDPGRMLAPRWTSREERATCHVALCSFCGPTQRLLTAATPGCLEAGHGEQGGSDPQPQGGLESRMISVLPRGSLEGLGHVSEKEEEGNEEKELAGEASGASRTSDR